MNRRILAGLLGGLAAFVWSIIAVGGRTRS
jgi:hypothetical protein